MTHLDYTWEKREQMIRKEEFEEGVAEGRATGLSEGLDRGRTEGLNEGKRAAAVNLKAINMPIEQIAQVLEENVEVVEQWLEETSYEKSSIN